MSLHMKSIIIIFLAYSQLYFWPLYLLHSRIYLLRRGQVCKACGPLLMCSAWPRGQKLVPESLVLSIIDKEQMTIDTHNIFKDSWRIMNTETVLDGNRVKQALRKYSFVVEVGFETQATDSLLLHEMLRAFGRLKL